MRERIARFFVNKWRIVAGDQLVDDRVGFGDRDQVLFGADFRDLFVQVVQQREAAIVGLQQPGRVQKTEIAVERFTKPPEQSAQLRNEAQYLRSVRRFGADPFVVRTEGVLHAFTVRDDLPVVYPRQVAGAALAAVGEIFRTQSRVGDHRQRFGGGSPHFVFDGPASGDRLAYDGRQLFRRDRFALQCFVLFPEKFPA